MKSSWIGFIIFIIGTSIIFSLNSCTKQPLSTVYKVPQDSTITDTTEFIDFTLDGNRVFEICNVTALPESGWDWGRLTDWGSSILPDTVYYPLSSFKGGLVSDVPTSTPGFYFIRNGYGLNMNNYTADKAWWTPLVLKTFVDSLFQPANYNFTVSTNKDTVFSFTPFADPVSRTLLGSGVQLSWIDSNGKIWQTSGGTADQTGSFFTITKNVSTPFTFQTGYEDYAESTFVTASFDCKLYDGEGHIMHLTKGRFRLFLNFKLI